MKTEFYLDVVSDRRQKGEIKIIGERGGALKNITPYVRIGISNSEDKEFVCACLLDKDIERFAVNILKALKSKKLARIRNK